MIRRRPRFLHSAMVGVLVVAALTSACVSRNIESISSEEAAGMTPPPPPEPVASPADAAAPAGEPGAPGPGPAAPGEEPASGGGQAGAASGIEVTVDVDPAAAGGVPSGATLYLIVRVAGREGGAPIAVKRLAGTVPVTVTIGDADAMMPGTPLIGDLDVIARIDQDGSATTREPGDLEGRIGPVQAAVDTGRRLP